MQPQQVIFLTTLSHVVITITLDISIDINSTRCGFVMEAETSQIVYVVRNYLF